MSNANNFLADIAKDKNKLLPAIAIAAIVIVGGLMYLNANGGVSLPFGQSPETIAQNAIDYINSNQLSQEPATLVAGSLTQESGLVKFRIQIGANSFDSYATKDGKFLFPQAFDLSGGANVAAGDNQPTGSAPKVAAADIQKTENPVVDAYVVSQCPYGLQIQRAMAKAIETNPAIAQNMKVRYIGSVGGAVGITAMHGDAEARENLRQICIREEQPKAYWSYVSCYMKAGDAAGCEKPSGVNSANLTACFDDKSRGVAYAAADFALQAKYGANASPTLILGESTVSEFDFGGRSPDALKQLICAASATEPSFCKDAFDTNQAATSFSLTYSSGATGPNNAAPNCPVL